MRKLLLVLVLAACGDPTGPSADPMTGTWSASQVDVLFNVTFNLTEHSPSDIRGTWRGTVAGHSRESSGSIKSGSRNGDAVTITMEPISPCGYGGYVLTVTHSGNTATGAAQLADCDGNPSGYSVAVTLKRWHHPITT